jgi:hypothetical protein
MSDEDVRDGLRDSFGDQLAAALALRSQVEAPTETVAAVQRRAHRQRSRRMLGGAFAIVLVAASVLAVVIVTRGGDGVRTIVPSNTTISPPNTTSAVPSTTTPTSPTTVPKPVVTPKLGSIVTATGVGSLRFGVATAADVRSHEGTPDGDVRGSFGMAGVPDYRALGYGCSSVKSALGIHIGPYGSDAPPYCRTVFFINVDTQTLAGFETTSPAYSTAKSTTPGMSEAAARSREGQPSTQGCFTGILIGPRAGDGSPQVFVFVGVHVTDRVSAIAADNPGNSVGVLFC